MRERIAADGYAYLPRHAAGSDTLSVASELGEPMILWEDAVVQQLVPRETSTPNTYSGIFGLKQFPFHTDLAHWRWPPRYILIRCLKGFHDVPTLLIDGHEIVEEVTLEVMRRAVVRPRRPQSGIMRLLRLWQAEDRGHGLFRWDKIFLEPASRIGGLAFGKVLEELKKIAITPLAMVEVGDTLVIDNWRMLHSRSAVPVGRENRHLERVYLGRLS